MHEGLHVTYIGQGEHDLVLGDRGQVISAANQASHVLWSTGSARGQVAFVDDLDLTPTTKQATTAVVDGLEDSLEVGTVQVTAAREVFDEVGEVGLLNMMAAEGHLAAFSTIAEDTLAQIAARIRNDPSFRSVTAVLDDDEGESLVRLATVVLLRDVLED